MARKRSSPSSSPPHDEAKARRQLRKDVFVSVLALISVGIGIYDATHPRTNARFTWLDFVDLGIVLIFIFDFSYAARASGKPVEYVKKHWYELPALIPITGNMVKGAEVVPFLRGVRLVRLLRVARLIRVAGTLARLRQLWQKMLRIARRAHIAGLAVFAVCAIVAGSGVIWLLEAPYQEKLANPGDALWWCLNMFTNVAYVDFQPATAAGRVVAAVLEIMGIGFIGLFTASLAGALLTDKEEGPRKPLPPVD